MGCKIILPEFDFLLQFTYPHNGYNHSVYSVGEIKELNETIHGKHLKYLAYSKYTKNINIYNC